VVAAIDAAKDRAGSAVPVPVRLAAPVAHVIERGEAASEVEADFSQPYVRASLQPVSGVEMHLASLADLSNMVARVVSVEAPIHLNELTKRLMDAFDVVRAGARITSRVREAVDHCVRRGTIRFQGEFVYGTSVGRISPRDRSSFGASDKKIEFVAPEEIEAALLESVRLGYSLSVGDAISSAIGMLGFGRSTQKIAATVEDSLSALIQSGALERAGGVITLSVGPS
jgi:hypothetical protein